MIWTCDSADQKATIALRKNNIHAGSHQIGFCGLRGPTQLLFRERGVQTEQHRASRKAFQRRPLGAISLLLSQVFDAPFFTSNNAFPSKRKLTSNCAPGTSVRNQTNLLISQSFFQEINGNRIRNYALLSLK